MSFRKLQHTIHVSWLLAALSFGVLIGAALALHTGSWFSLVQIGLLATPLLIVVFRKRYVWMLFVMVTLGLLIGQARGVGMQTSLGGYADFYGSNVTAVGKISEDTVLGPRGDQRVRLGAVIINEHELPGHIWISTSSQADLKRGDLAAFRGALNEGFGNLPASMFRAQLVAADRLAHGDVAREVRDWFADKVRTAISEPEASLGIGYLVGQRSTLPQELDDQLRLLGLTHVVVASGYNLTILVRFARRWFEDISKYLSFASAASMITAFVLITGFSPSMSRAALVAGLSLAAWYFGRSIHPLVLLPVSAAVTVLLNPLFIWGDIGWYLSFASFAGILLLAPLVRHALWGAKKELGVFQRILLETMSAQIATLPIIAFVFGQYSPLALPANLLVLPLVPLAMLLTFGAGLGTLVLPAIASWFGFPAYVILRYMTSVTEWLAALPWALGEMQFGLPALIGSYAIMIVAIALLWRKTRHSFKNDNIVV